MGRIYLPTCFEDSATHNVISLLLLSARSAKARLVLPPCEVGRGSFTAKCLEVRQSTRTHPADGWTLKT